MQFLALIASFVLTVFCALLVMALGPWWSAGAVLFGLLTLIGIYDLVQSKHNITRSYPIMGHLRFLQEAIAPEIHQYFIEGNTEGRPFDRDQRALVYERSKNISELKPFGTERDVYSNEFEWINHSMAPKPKRGRSPDCPARRSLRTTPATAPGADPHGTRGAPLSPRHSPPVAAPCRRLPEPWPLRLGRGAG